MQQAFEKKHMTAKKGGLVDDVQWLPPGPPGRFNKVCVEGCKGDVKFVCV